MKEVIEFSFLSFLALPKCRHFKGLPISLFTAFLLSFNKIYGHQILRWAPDRTLGKKFSLWTCVHGLLQNVWTARDIWLNGKTQNKIFLRAIPKKARHGLINDLCCHTSLF